MTATHRKKPIEIEARQLTRKNGRELWEWADSKPYYGPDDKIDGLTIFTLEGRMKADFGDWIIKGVKGEFYPCKPDVFEASYEAINAEKAANKEAADELWDTAVDWLLNSRYTGDPDIQKAFWGVVDGRCTVDEADRGELADGSPIPDRMSDS